MSSSKEDVLRGLHTSRYYKIISVIRGEIYDVIVDLRKDSPTFLKWTAALLSAESIICFISNFIEVLDIFLDNKQIVVPCDCAHGFLCTKEAIITYVQGGTYDASQEKVYFLSFLHSLSHL